MIVTDTRVARFVGKRCGTIIYPPFTAMGIEREGEIIAGAVFNSYTGADIGVTVAGSGFTRGFFVNVGDYVFRQIACLRMTAITEQEKVIRIAMRLGARQEGVLRDHFGAGRDGIVLGILKADYPFRVATPQPVHRRPFSPEPGWPIMGASAHSAIH